MSPTLKSPENLPAQEYSQELSSQSRKARTTLLSNDTTRDKSKTVLALPCRFHTPVKMNETQLHTMIQMPLGKRRLCEKKWVIDAYMVNQLVFEAQSQAMVKDMCICGRNPFLNVRK